MFYCADRTQQEQDEWERYRVPVSTLGFFSVITYAEPFGSKPGTPRISLVRISSVNTRVWSEWLSRWSSFFSMKYQPIRPDVSGVLLARRGVGLRGVLDRTPEPCRASLPPAPSHAQA